MREREGLQVRAEQAGYTAELPVRSITLPSPLLPFLLFLPQPATHPRGRAPRPNARAAKIRQPSCVLQRSSGFGAELRSRRERQSSAHAAPRHATPRRAPAHLDRSALEQRVLAFCCHLLPAACRLLCLFASPTCCSRLASEPTSPRIAWLSSFSFSLWLRLSPFLLHLPPRQRSNCRTCAAFRISIHRLTIPSLRDVGHPIRLSLSPSHHHHRYCHRRTPSRLRSRLKHAS